MKDNTTKMAVAFLLGGLIGAAVALLYAPKSGYETRKDIAKTAGRIKRKTADLIDDTVQSVHDFTDDVKERATDIIEEGKELSDSAKKELVSAFEHGQKAIEKQKNRIIKALGL